MPGAVTQIEDHKGDHYYDVMKRVHETIDPRSYLEIGTRTGGSLILSKCVSVAVDPKFHITSNIIGAKPACFFYQMTSDRFFKSVDIAPIVGGEIDFAFLDGMHLFEFLLRDFYNTEKLCGKHSIIALHDCLPPDVRYTSRYERDSDIRKDASHPHWWAGDVWKVPVILRRLRPDLHIIALDAPPTGLILVTNLDPASRVLENGYRAIVDEFSQLNLESLGLDKLSEELGVISTAKLKTFEDIASHLS
jgi:hypothetical protein